MAAIGKSFVSIKHSDVVEPEKSALEDVVTFRVFAVHPPGESEQHLVKNSLEKRPVAFAGLLSLDLINSPGRPRDYGWIDVTEVPFIRRNLPVGMLVPFAGDDIQLRFGEAGIDQGEGNTMKRQIP